MELLEGMLEVGDDADGEDFPDVDALVERLDGIAADHDVTVQAFDARYVVSRRHLERAVELADRERARGEAIARDRSVEILLYAAGRRQIDRALEMGVGEGETPTVVLVDGGGGGDVGGDRDGADGGSDAATGDETNADDGGDEAAAADAVRSLLAAADTLGAYDERLVREFFDVADRELATTSADLEALVLERVALLVVER